MAQKRLGKAIIETGKSTSKAFDYFFTSLCDDKLNPAIGMVFGYIVRHPEVRFQDIVAEFSLAKATVSDYLAVLLERGYIKYEKSVEDAREKVIILTEAGMRRSSLFLSVVEQFDNRIETALTEEERDTLFRLLDKIKAVTEDINNGK